MKSLFLILVICIVLITTQGCYYDKEEILYPSACDTTVVTYAQTVKPTINAYCLSCHGTSSYNMLGGSINLDGYTNLIKQVQSGQLLKSIKHEAGASQMPKNQQQLSACNIAKIQTWINASAPNN